MLAMADGDPSGYQTLMNLPVSEFFYLCESWHKRITHLTRKR